MKKIILCLNLLFFLSTNLIFSQWQQTNGPVGMTNTYFVDKHLGVIFIRSTNNFYRSTDDGKSWEIVKAENITEIVDENSGFFYNNFYDMASYKDEIFLATIKGLFVSKDKGITWEEILDNNKKSFSEVKSIYIDSNKIYIGRHRLFSAIIGEYIWQNVSPKYRNSFLVQDIEKKDGTLFVGLSNLISGSMGDPGWMFPRNGTFFYSTDEGKNWDSISFNKNLIITDLFVDSDFIFASTESGLIKINIKNYDWEFIGSMIHDQPCYKITKLNNSLFVKTDEKIYQTQDLFFWFPIELKGIHNSLLAWQENITCFDNKLYLPTNGGIYTRDGDNSSNWECITDNIIGSSVYDLYSDNKTIFALTIGNSIARTTDGGNNWSQSIFQNGTSYKSNLISIKGDTNNLIVVESYGPGVFLSNDYGVTWKKITSNTTHKITFGAMIIDSTILISTELGLFSSPLNNIDWIKRSNYNRVMHFYESNSIIYGVANKNSLVQSTDRGITWNTKVTHPAFKDLNSGKVKGDSIVLASDDNLYLSKNGGFSWKIDSTSKFQIRKFLLYNNYIIIASQTKGILVSNDFGNTWVEKNTNLPNLHILGMTILDEEMYVNCRDNGVYKAKLLDLDIIPTSINDVETLPTYLYSYSPYPIPAKSEVSTVLYWDPVFDIDNAQISVYNIYGVEIQGKENITINKNTQYSGILNWDCSKINNGTYFIQINHGTNKKSIKVIVQN